MRQANKPMFLLDSDTAALIVDVFGAQFSVV
jgi:hypothetical protein